MSEIKVVRRWPRRESAGSQATSVSSLMPALAMIGLVGIGASTGGPPVLQSILAGLPEDFSAPLLIVQHIAPGFLTGLVDWLGQTSGLKVHVAADGTRPQSGHVYLAPDDFHMAIQADGRLKLTGEGSEEGLRPSIAHLFRSLAEVCGAGAVGVLLTGMGKDGAQELKRMRDCGASTIVQDRKTSAVHGMPGEAISLDAATYVLPADKIAPALISLVKHRRSLESD